MKTFDDIIQKINKSNVDAAERLWDEALEQCAKMASERGQPELAYEIRQYKTHLNY